MAHAKSKRQSSAQRHKVERKIREHKRDIRKAARKMKASGVKLRSKKSRETAKLALRVSNAHPDKEGILKGLVSARERAKTERAARREQTAAEAARVRDEKEASASESGSDDASDADSAEGEEAGRRIFKRTRAELEPTEERLSSKQVAERERAARRDAAAKAATEKQKQAMSQHLLIPAGEDVGNPYLQFAKIVEHLPLDVPAFAVVLDARCPVQSVPWDHVDAIVNAAVARAEQQEGAAASSASSPKRSPKGAAKAKAAAAVQRLVLFVLNKADLVPLEVLLVGMSHVAEAVHDRYADILAPVMPTRRSGGMPDPGPAVATAPVAFSCLPHSAVVDLTSKIVLRSLRQFHNDYVDCRDEATVARSNMKGKLGVCVIGLPGVGKTTFIRAVHEIGTDSVVSSVPCRTIRTAHLRDAQGAAAADSTKIIIPSAKQVTFVTIADDEALKATPIVAGDAVFHSISRLEKMKEPENAALMLAEAFADQTSLCQAFSLPAMPTAAAFLKAFGRCIIRERGFQPSGVFAGVGGSLSTSALSVSDAGGAAAYVAGLRKVFVKRRHDDGRNPLRVGARTFLKAFHEGKHVVWSAQPPSSSAKPADEAAKAVNTFSLLHTPKQVLALLGENAASEALASPGAALLLVAQFAMRDCIAILPHKALSIAASAIVPPMLEDEDEDEEEEDDDEEEEEGMDEDDEEEESNDGDDDDDDDDDDEADEEEEDE